MRNPYAVVGSCSTVFSFLLLSLVLCRGDFVTNDETIQTSIVRLLARPEDYNGKRVEFIAYYLSAQEVSAAFLSKEAADSGNSQLAIWVSVPANASTNIPIESVKQGYVLVRGTFKYDAKLGSGHLGMWPGEISPVEVFKRVRPKH